MDGDLIFDDESKTDDTEDYNISKLINELELGDDIASKVSISDESNSGDHETMPVLSRCVSVDTSIEEQSDDEQTFIPQVLLENTTLLKDSKIVLKLKFRPVLQKLSVDFRNRVPEATFHRCFMSCAVNQDEMVKIHY